MTPWPTIATAVLPCALAAVAVGSLAYALGTAPSRARSSLGLRGAKRERAAAQSAVFAALEPTLRWLGARVEGLLSEQHRARLDARLVTAGDYLGLTAAEHVAGSAMGGALGLAVGLALTHTFHAGAVSVLMGALLGAALPHLHVSGVAHERQRAIARALPYAIDLLALAMSAGLDFPGALRQLVDEATCAREPLVEELALVEQRLGLGRTRREALEALAQRVRVRAVSEIVAALVQADEQGTPVATALKIQASILRNRRSVRAEEAAAKAGVQMVVPLLLVVVCVLGLVLAPTMLSMNGSL